MVINDFDFVNNDICQISQSKRFFLFYKKIKEYI